jgi:EmrB/QacA subfamily drug resistance transporter
MELTQKQPQSQPRELYGRRWWALAVLCLSLVVIGLDNTVLNVALPTLVVDLKATASELQWIVDAYVLVFAGLLLTAGNLGDRFGRKRALDFGMIIFVVGSFLSAYAGSSHQLIATRALMGFGGAFIMPSTLSILTNIFPPNERGRAIAIWTATAGIAIPAGPVIGGWMLEHFWWGSIFLINVPVIAIALVAGFFLIPESRDPEHAALDPAGAVLSIAGLGVLIYGIIEAPDNGWLSARTLIFFAVALVLLGAFALWEMRTPRPMLNTRFFRNPRFSAASLSIALVFFALFGSMFFLTQYLQFVLGYGTLEAGLRIVPVALGILIGAPASVRLVKLLGSKLVVAAGLAIVAAGLFLMSRTTMTSGYEFIGLSLPLIGLGMGLTMAPATDSIMGSIPRENAGVGSAMNDTMRQVGGALGVAVLGSVLSTSYTNHVGTFTSALPQPQSELVSNSIGAALEVARRIGGANGQFLASSANHAFIDAMNVTLIAAAAVALFGALVSLAFLPAEEVPTEYDVEAMPSREDARVPELGGSRR